MDHQPFFKRGPSALARLAFFGLLSVALMAVDARFNQLEPLRQLVGLALHPLQQIANSPLALSRRAGEFFVTQNQLASENTRLKQQQLTTSLQVQRNQSLQAENAYLRRLLASREKSGDSAIAVPVEVVRNGLHAIAFGHGRDNMLELAFMATNMDIQNGDKLVTSGIDGTYPRGVPVATVTRIERNAGDPFAKIICTPSAGVGRYRHLLVVSAPSPMPQTAPASSGGKQ